MFDNQDVTQLVDCAKRALEFEEHYLVGCFEAHHWDSGENGPGICRNLNERYYRFIVWRELMKSFHLRAITERGDYDLAFTMMPITFRHMRKSRAGGASQANRSYKESSEISKESSGLRTFRV